jgi:hypothetical protein
MKNGIDIKSPLSMKKYSEWGMKNGIDIKSPLSMKKYSEWGMKNGMDIKFLCKKCVFLRNLFLW